MNCEMENSTLPASQINDSTSKNEGTLFEENSNNRSTSSCQEAFTEIPHLPVEDEDIALGGDESAKEFDGNIDEDELLKDTDNDENVHKDSRFKSQGNIDHNDACQNPPDGPILKTIHSKSLSLNHDKNILVSKEKKMSLADDKITRISCSESKESDVCASSNDGDDSNAVSGIDNENKTANSRSTEASSEKSNPKELENNTQSDAPDVSNDSLISQEDREPVTSDNTTSDNTEDNTQISVNNKPVCLHEVNESDEVQKIINNTVDGTKKLSTEEIKDNEIAQTSCLIDTSHVNVKPSIELIRDGSINIEGSKETAVNNEAIDGHVSSAEEKYDESENNADVTKFVHVDQDNSRHEETSYQMEVEGEDPFAQTSDDVNLMETSDNLEKPTDEEKTCTDIREPIDDCNEAQLNKEQSARPPEACSNNVDVGESDREKSNIQSADPNAKDSDPITIDGDPITIDGAPITIDGDPTTSDGDPINSDGDKCNETKNNTEQSDCSLSTDKGPSSVICIVPDKIDKQNQESSILQTKVTNTSKTVSSKPSNQIKSKKSKIDLEESSETDSDIEIGAKPNRPKRSAAKKAEKQIKVLSEVERAENEDIGRVVEEQDTEQVTSTPSDLQTCFTCKKVKHCKINASTYGKHNHFCGDVCFASFRDGPILKPGEGTEIVPPSSLIKDIKPTATKIPPIERSSFIRKCSQCTIVLKNDDEKILSWETMDFCSEECLGKYQQELGSHCANCKGSVQAASLGKYCVRFGYEVKQFCCATCLEEFKKGLKVCSFCQKDISSGAEGFLAPVGDKGAFKDFCTQGCMEKYEQMSSNSAPPPEMHNCDVCANHKLVEVQVLFDSKVNKLCSDICFTAYKFANNLSVDECDMCHKYFDKEAEGEKFNIFYEGLAHNFCSKTCMNVYILAKRRIVPCNWCKVKKYNFDMIKQVHSNGQALMMCSLNCLTLYHVSVNAVSSRRIKCDMCLSMVQAQYHLTMSDASIRNFCTYPCVMNFQQQYGKSPITLLSSDSTPTPTGGPVPIISSVKSLSNGQPAPGNTATPIKAPSGKPHLVTRMYEPPLCRNKNTQTGPITIHKSVSCRPHSTSISIQTDEVKVKPLLIPIPVPIYVPCPMAMYSVPFPVPIPFPIPIPVPVFLPTTRNSIKGIVKEIKRIQEKVPADPFEAELLMMAEMVASNKEEAVNSSDSEPDNDVAADDSRPNSAGEGEFSSPETVENSNTFGDDIMQIALKMATELDEPAEDLESQLTPSTIVNQPRTESPATDSELSKKNGNGEARGRKRALTKSSQKQTKSADLKKKKPNSNPEVASQLSLPQVEEPKPDANMKLKYTFGVNAWKTWIAQKNAEIEKISSTNKKVKPFKTDILQLTADELNFSLCLFVKEVKKPNGQEYAPDTIYYLCLGIQQYLFENGRIDNIFTDNYYESFTDALDKVAVKFIELFSDHHYIVTRVEEEHLWECKQLGAHSPHVLLSTLMFFNTKHFNLTSVDEHTMLSFSHIMKHWKRNPNQPPGTGANSKAPGSRNVLLRFYPPQALVDDPNSKKKKMYEQHENEESPLRCPVKLYEFYLSKCPDSVKTRSDVFYMQPERSCVPDSPVWYSTMALTKEPLQKMLNRVKMIKEINVALLTP